MYDIFCTERKKEKIEYPSSSAEQKNLVRFYRTIMKSYGSTFVTFPSHLPQREETCQKSLHHQKTKHTYLQMYYSSNMLSVAKKCTDIHVK